MPSKNELTSILRHKSHSTLDARATLSNRFEREYSVSHDSMMQWSIFRSLPQWTWAVAIVVACLSLVTANPELTAACAIVPAIVVSLLWKRSESPVMLFAVAVQWLQVATPVFYSDFQGVPIYELNKLRHIELATGLSLIGIVTLALGIRLAWVGIKNGVIVTTEAELRELNPRRIFLAWLAAFGIASLAGVVAWRAGGLTQLILAVTTVKWVVFFVLAYQVFVTDEGYRFVLAVIGIEYLLGLTGYFAGYLPILLMIIIVAFCPRVRLRPRTLSIVISAFVIAMATSLVWTTVKMKYRAYLNQGTRQQTAAVTLQERATKMQELMLSTSSSDIAKSVDMLVARVGYTELFARTIAHVPSTVPHEDGKLWRGAVLHVLQPRLLFPNKEGLHDSDRARRYTGLRVAGVAEGTSIGIGYMAESYIDFGPYMMFVPIFLLGLCYGLVYRYFVFSNHSRLLGTAIATGILFFTWQGFATTNGKICGALITQCVVMAALNWAFGTKLMNWLRHAKSARRNYTGIEVR